MHKALARRKSPCDNAYVACSYTYSPLGAHASIWWLYSVIYKKDNHTCFNLLWPPADQRF